MTVKALLGGQNQALSVWPRLPCPVFRDIGIQDLRVNPVLRVNNFRHIRKAFLTHVFPSAS
jgi:hypothetical protein